MHAEIKKVRTMPEKMEKFSPTKESDLQKMILKGNSKSCALDPIPTSLLKDVLPHMLPTLCRISNISIETNTMPDMLKLATVTPLLNEKRI